MKKGLSIIFGILFTVSILLSNCYAFPDVDALSDEGMAITKMQNCGYIQGFDDETFRPDGTLTRAEFVTIINKMYNYTVDMDNIFIDIKSDEWYYKAVLIGVQAGYIKGHDDKTFRPNDPVTREQVCVMLNRILNVAEIPFSQDITDAVSDWAKDSVKKLISNRLFMLEDGGKFRATEPITRAEVCMALEKCIIDVPVNIEPIDLDALAREEVERRLKDIISVMETNLFPQYTYEVNKEIARKVVASMKKYLENPQHDYVSDARAIYDIYKNSGSASREFKNLIYKNMDIDEITILFEFFYTPEMLQ